MNVTEVDRAFSLRAKGDAEGALRAATAVLEADPGQLGAVAILAAGLAQAGRKPKAVEALRRLVGAFVRRGDLGSAVTAAKFLETAGAPARAELRAIATAFGKGSPRLADVSAAPPAMPTRASVVGPLASLAGAPLLERAEAALGSFLGSPDPVPEGSKLPALPLFASLAPPLLEQLFGAMTVREVADGESVVRVGDEGDAAFLLVRGLAEVRKPEGHEERVIAQLGPGALFGEMALVTSAPRAATVAALHPLVVLVMARDALEALATKEPAIGRELGSFGRGRMIANLLRHGTLLGAVAPEARAELVTHFQTRSYEAGDVIVREGQEPSGLFLVASGEVAVDRLDADGDRLRLATLGPGEVVGEISLVLRRPANATVTALHPTIALHLDREEFQRVIKQHPALLAELYDIATRRDEETRSIVAQEAADAGEVVLL